MTPSELRAILAKHAITQQRFADMMGVNKVTVYRWVAGDRPIPHPVAILAGWLDAGVIPASMLDEIAGPA